MVIWLVSKEERLKKCNSFNVGIYYFGERHMWNAHCAYMYVLVLCVNSVGGISILHNKITEALKRSCKTWVIKKCF